MAFTLSLLLFFIVVRYIVPRVLRALLGNFVRQQVYKSQQAKSFPSSFGPLGGFGNTNTHRQSYWADAARATQPGQVHVEYVPEAAKTRQGEFQGGEYVDYEEVK